MKNLTPEERRQQQEQQQQAQTRSQQLDAALKRPGMKNFTRYRKRITRHRRR